jgi:hypothetical protein
MNIPFEKIYDYISSRFNVDCVIYRFLPHGSRKLEDLTQLNNTDLDWLELVKAPTVIMHDQEPLYPDLYSASQVRSCLPAWFANNMPFADSMINNDAILNYLCDHNLAFVRRGFTIYDKSILVHSELNSAQAQFYEHNGFALVYWWSHAMIARDWYRYAEVDPDLQTSQSPSVLFNVYNRAWTGSREYRLKFADLVLQAGLESHCSMTFASHDQGLYWRDHEFVNPQFSPKNNLETLPSSVAQSWFSADYSTRDYKAAWWDVVLETIFDDTRIHLTEKILRPIACAKPFILAAAPGSLATLRRYGFRTFSDVIDESYDLQYDSLKRMEKIIAVLQDIATWSVHAQNLAQQRIREITAHNQRRFFSQQFQDDVLQELDVNFAQALGLCQAHQQGRQWSKIRALARSQADSRNFFVQDNVARSRSDIAKICHELRRTRRLSRDSSPQAKVVLETV